jgi:hypothetical protein
MLHCGTIVSLLGKNIIQVQVTAILHRIYRGLQHHSNPAYKNMTSLLQVVFQICLLNGEFVGNLTLSMRSSSSIMHHILQSAHLHDTSDESNYFTAEPFNLFVNLASNPQPIHPLVTDKLVYEAYNIPYTRNVLNTLLQSLELSQNETTDPYAIVAWIGWEISTKTPFTLISKPNTVSILTFHINPNHDLEPTNLTTAIRHPTHQGPPVARTTPPLSSNPTPACLL